MHRRALVVVAVLAVSANLSLAAEFASDWHRQPDHIWIGPAYWANPMEDWRIRDGRLQCTSSDANRSVHLLTHRLGEQDGTLELSVVVGLQQPEGNQSPDRQGGDTPQGSVGFEIGIQSELGDYRSSLIRGDGIRVALTSDGRVLSSFSRSAEHGTITFDEQVARDIAQRLRTTGLRLKWFGQIGGDNESLAFRIHDPESDELLTVAGITTGVSGLKPRGAIGNIALVHNPNWGGQRAEQNRRVQRPSARFWFRDLKVSGTKVDENPEHAFGPILYAMHTLSRGTVSMTAQMPPIGPQDDQTVELQVPLEAAQKILRVPGVRESEISNLKSEISDLSSQTPWTTIGRSTIDPLSRTAHFRISHWPDSEDVPYRLVYTMRTTDGASRDDHYTGTVRRDPVDKPTISVAGFTGHKDTAFPNELLVSNVLKHDPDLCLFTGDQIYEDAGGFGIVREPADRAVLNYLRKIYLWGWSFRDVLRDRPSFVLPDDHDVYQGNVWGAGGNPTEEGITDHAAGGFAEPADFVDAVFRTQVGHHPPAYDPTPMMQGIDCWYGDCVYGRISFAIIEDRYFKTGPEGKVNDWPGRPDHVKDVNYDTSKLDKPGLTLLGERQLAFLDHWAQDWRGADMKCVCSQTIFCNLANYHGENQEFVFADLDSNGWPQTGRNKALDAMRKGFAFHYAGDQHLPSIVHHGIDTWGDAGWSFCVPSTAAGYPRSWRADDEGRPVQNRPPGGLPNTGEYRDAFGNFMTVHAIGNPAEMNRKPVLELLHDKSSGYGLVHFNKEDRTITMECWKLLFDAAKPQADDQFPGWQKTIAMLDNYGRDATLFLPELRVDGISGIVVQIVHEQTKEIVYTLRIPGESFRPKVFAPGTYTVRTSMGGENWREFRGLTAGSNSVDDVIRIDFPE
jgi:hypothetical protein